MPGHMSRVRIAEKLADEHPSIMAFVFQNLGAGLSKYLFCFKIWKYKLDTRWELPAARFCLDPCLAHVVYLYLVKRIF
ncbi:hypothetical protein BH24ACI3_BH24ACI3_17570 [soil metagenome]